MTVSALMKKLGLGSALVAGVLLSSGLLPAQSKKASKVTIQHCDPNEDNTSATISVSANALGGHESHGGPFSMNGDTYVEDTYPGADGVACITFAGPTETSYAVFGALAAGTIGLLMLRRKAVQN